MQKSIEEYASGAYQLPIRSLSELRQLGLLSFVFSLFPFHFFLGNTSVYWETQAICESEKGKIASYSLTFLI